MKFNCNMYKINCYLVAFIISIQCIHFAMLILRIPWTNFMSYCLFLIFVIVSFFLYRQRGDRLKDIHLLLIFSYILSCYSVFTCMFGRMGDIISGIKLICVFIVSFFIYLMEKKEYRMVVNNTYCIVSIYLLFLICVPGDLSRFMLRGKTNYLLTTMPIGFVLSMLMARIVAKIYSNWRNRTLFLDGAGIVLCFVGLTRFAARGSIIFPFLTTIILCLFWGKKHYVKSLFLVFCIFLAVYIGYEYFLEHAETYMISRMNRLFINYENESRWGLWTNYIYMILNEWQLLGGGIGCSMRELGYYPHNLYLQYIGEFGLLGFIFSIYLTILVCVNQFKNIRQIQECDADIVLLAELSAGLLYLFLCFMKSFSIYDSVSFMMMAMAVLSLSMQIRKKNKEVHNEKLRTKDVRLFGENQ